MLFVPSLLALFVLVATYPVVRFDRRIAAVVDLVPGWLLPAGGFVEGLLSAAAIAAAVTTILARRRIVALQALLSYAIAVALAFVSARVALGDWLGARDLVAVGSSAPRFPAVRLAEAGAVLLTINAHLIRPIQRAGRWLLALGLIGALLADFTSASGIIAALLIAVATAAGVRLAIGTSAGRPELADVAAALAELRIAVTDLQVADRQLEGVFVVRGRDSDGTRLLVKVHGRDAYDNQLLEKLWRLVWYQDGGPNLRLSRSQIVEHEAFSTLLARKEGVPTHDVLRAGTTAGDNVLLVLRGDTRALGPPSGGESSEATLDRAWSTLERLHNANIAHLRIDPTTVVQIDGEVGLVDFRGSTASPRADQLSTDRAQLLVTTAVQFGSEPALAAAVRAVGHDGIAALLPYLQVAALEGGLRQATRTAGTDVDELRETAAARVGVADPPLARLRRITWGALVQTALLLLAAFAVLSFATGIDYDGLAAGLRDASWGWIVAGMLVAQVPRATQAIATLGAVAANLRFRPVYAMQLATNYMNLALPSAAARLAISIRFFQRQGIPPAAAITGGAIDSLASMVLQAVLLVLLVIFDLATPRVADLDFSAPFDGSLTIVVIVAVLVTAAVVATVVVARIRQAITGRVRAWWPQIRAAAGTLRSTNKLALLFFGSLATELLFALALGLIAAGLGSTISLTTLLVINIEASPLSTFIPVPGGIGVSELALTIGLSAAGMTEEAALATALLYRIATFYLPPIWGFFAMRWLQQKRYL